MQAAELLNVVGRTLRCAKRFAEEVVQKLIAAVEKRDVSVSTAADLATLSKLEQVAIKDGGDRQILQSAKVIRAKRADNSRTQRIVKIATGKKEFSTKTSSS